MEAEVKLFETEIMLWRATSALPVSFRLRTIISNARHKGSLKGAIANAIYYTWRFLEGARRVETAGSGEGSYYADGVEIDFGGNCPVQGDGTIDGYGCYYRSRGEGWQFEVYEGDEESGKTSIWDYDESKYFWPSGGWVSPRVSQQNIAKAVKLFRERAS